MCHQHEGKSYPKVFCPLSQRSAFVSSRTDHSRESTTFPLLGAHRKRLRQHSACFPERLPKRRKSLLQYQSSLVGFCCAAPRKGDFLPFLSMEECNLFLADNLLSLNLYLLLFHRWFWHHFFLVHLCAKLASLLSRDRKQMHSNVLSHIQDETILIFMIY